MNALIQAAANSPGLAGENPPVLSVAADRYNRYPGEQTRYHVRFTAPDQAGAVLQFAMPKILKLENFELPVDTPQTAHSLHEEDQDTVFSLPLEPYFQAGQTYEISFLVSMTTIHFNQYLAVEARLIGRDGQATAQAATQVAVFGKGRYLRFLPELYEGDDFMGRFLMLFESFWKPISQQIDQVENYFDPGLTPPAFIPWLASWIGMPIDDTLPLERQRALVKSAMTFYQRRGTRMALKTYLEVYTSGEAMITERRARNFTLGEGSLLGVDIALGSNNQPNSISVRLRVPASELERTGYTEEMYSGKIGDLVRWMIPAHAVYDLDCEFTL